jgi:hypothetical protein
MEGTITTAAGALATAPKAIVISQFDVLLGDIKEAAAGAASVSFNYADPKGNKAARSYVHGIRKLNARIETARKEAKAYALAYGRTVDSQATELKNQVDALIRPHQEAIDAIAKAEADRVQRHRDKIHFITDLGRVPFGASSAAIAISLEGAKAADIDGLEEFKPEAAAALLETIRTLEAAHAEALGDEALAVELEQLREQQRIQREEDAEVERERQAQERADTAAVAAVEAAERKAAEAQARAAAAEAALARQQEVKARADAAAEAARDQEEADKTVRAMHLEEMESAAGPITTAAIRAADAAISDQAIEAEFRAWWESEVHPLPPSSHAVSTHVAWGRHLLSRRRP